MNRLLMLAAERAIAYVNGVRDRRVYPDAGAIAALAQFDQPMPDNPTDPEEVLKLLDDIGSPATVAMTGGRYFGFVNGATLPATLAANWLAGTWDQNSALRVMSPVSATLETVTLGWLVDVLGLPQGTGGGFVSGATMANFSGLAAARHALLSRAGWDVEAQGLFGAPEIKVVVGDEVHVSLLKALGMVGFGRERVIRVPVDDQGRMRADQLPPLDAMTIVCLQAGNVNTGAFDPATEICATAHKAGAWAHVDGAFGLWALVAPGRAPLAAGVPDADSWATDAHKWLNVPYDSGLVFCREPQHLRAAMSFSAAYLIEGEQREPMHYTPDMSRRGRGIEIWAALQSLGRSGLAEMIERTCRHATRFAEGLRDAGYDVLNQVDINQVLVSFGDAETTQQVIAGIQTDGTCWCGGTVWRGHTAMRISVSSWATTDEDVEHSLEAMIRVAQGVRVAG